jgi:hypothetical protein
MKMTKTYKKERQKMDAEKENIFLPPFFCLSFLFPLFLAGLVVGPAGAVELEELFVSFG